MTNPPDPESVAAGLTKAQVKAFRETTRDNPVLCGRPRTLRKLAELGLCVPPKPWENRRTIVLARPLGLAVRACLKDAQHDA